LKNDAIRPTTHADASKTQNSANIQLKNSAILAVIVLFLADQIAQIAHDFKMNMIK
jgi:hypothetical protein